MYPTPFMDTIAPIAVPHFLHMHAHVVVFGSNPSSAHTTTPQANLASVSHVVQADSSWFPDYGATNKLTNATPQPHTSTLYAAAGMVHVGNGSTLQISAIGSSIVPTDSRHLHLHNMLYTPDVTNNLIYVSKFSMDNKVYFVFHSTHCLINDSISNLGSIKGIRI